jgi:hypothetical protein
MKTPRTPIISVLLFFSAILFSGCAGTMQSTTPPTEAEIIDARLDSLSARLADLMTHTPRQVAPVAIMPGAARSGGHYSRLEEMVVERITASMREQHQVFVPGREHWFEFREGLALSNRGGHHPPPPGLVVLDVQMAPEPAFKRLKVRVVANDENGAAIPGLIAETYFPYETGSATKRLFKDDALANPFPVGLEERPYDSVDRLAFGLASELAVAYAQGITMDRAPVSEKEVRVLLSVKAADRSVPSRLVDHMTGALQHAIVSRTDFTNVAAAGDLAELFDKVDFYRKHQMGFDLEESVFTSGTIVLLAECFRHPSAGMNGLRMRAMWRVSPLETEDGSLITTNVAGTYLKGFTARAYMSDQATKRLPASVVIDPQTGKPPAPAALPQTRYVGAAADYAVCFHRFTEVYGNRIYSSLTSTAGVETIYRFDDLCGEAAECLCYQVGFTGSAEELISRLRENLRTSRVDAFRVVPRSGGVFDLYFTGGFD